MPWLLKAYVGAAVCCALPFLDDRLFFTMWLGLAILLTLQFWVRHRHQFLWLYGASILTLAIAMYWTPSAFANVMGTSFSVGVVSCLALVAFEALKMALPIWLGIRCGRNSTSTWLWAACFTILFETWFPGVFPWRLGYAFVSVPVLVQASSVLGPSFPTVVAFAGAGLIHYFVRTQLQDRELGSRSLVVIGDIDWQKRQNRKREACFGWLAGATLSASILYGVGALWAWQHMEAMPNHPEQQGGLRLVLVQANPTVGSGVTTAYELSQSALAELEEDEEVDLVCWPESIGGMYQPEANPELASVPNASRDDSAEAQPWQQPQPVSAPVLMGATTVADGEGQNVSALMFDENNRGLIAAHHKQYLMPFGEYIPFVHGLPSIQSMTGPWNLFAAGTSEPIHVGRASLGVMLCYEDMVPRAAREPVQKGANVLITLADGSAFNNPVALTQHRLLSQLRAIETRRTLVRCTSTGETCVISPTGEVVASLPKSRNGWLITEVDLYSTQTVYSSFGNQMPLLAILGLVALSIVTSRFKNEQKII